MPMRNLVLLATATFIGCRCAPAGPTTTDAAAHPDAAAVDSTHIDAAVQSDATGHHDAAVDAAAAADATGRPDSAPDAVGADASVDAGVDAGGATRCAPLPAATGTIVEVHPGDEDTIQSTVANAPAGATIIFNTGTYAMNGGGNHQINVRTDGLTLRSASGNPDDVVIDGDHVTGELIAIAASNVTVAELTLREAYFHPIHVTGRTDADISNVRLYRVHIVDPGEQAIKINPSADNHYADHGRIECSTIELTDSGRPHIRNNCYTGGIDAHAAWGWQIRDNEIAGFWCSEGLAEHGIHMWQTCRGSLVERNVIRDCARGIGFGLGETAGMNTRIYDPDPYPGISYIGHYDGVIRNNFVSAFGAVLTSSAGFDCGICLEQARGAQVLHNTVVSGGAPLSSSAEYRFANTAATIVNNLLSHNLNERTTGLPMTLAGNIENAPLDDFVEPTSGDLHLVPASAGAAIDHGAEIAAGRCDDDIDGDLRTGIRDVGADEVR